MIGRTMEFDYHVLATGIRNHHGFVGCCLQALFLFHTTISCVSPAHNKRKPPRAVGGFRIEF